MGEQLIRDFGAWLKTAVDGQVAPALLEFAAMKAMQYAVGACAALPLAVFLWRAKIEDEVGFILARVGAVVVALVALALAVEAGAAFLYPRAFILDYFLR